MEIDDAESFDPEDLIRAGACDVFGDPALDAAVDELNAKTVTKRKNAVDTISQLLDDDNVLARIDNNHIQKTRYKMIVGKPKAWKELVNILVHQFEVNCLGLKSTEEASKRANYCSLVCKCFQKALRNSENPMVEATTVVKTVVLCLSDPCLSQVPVCAERFLRILDHLLDIPACTDVMETENWNLMIRTLCLLITQEKLKPRILHEIMKKVILCASDHPGSLSLLRLKVVKAYTKVISKPSKSFKDNYSVILDAFIHLIKAIAPDARGILCAAGEQVITAVMQHADNSSEKDKACEFCLLQLQLHMPENCDVEATNAFFVHDKHLWETQVARMGSFCVEELEMTARNVKKVKASSKYLPVSSYLLELAVRCAHMGKLMKVSIDDDNMNAAKRFKPSISLDTVAEEVVGFPVDSGLLVWLKYLSEVLKKYPEMIGNSETCNKLIMLGKDLVHSSFIYSPEVLDFLKSLIVCEKYLMKKFQKEPSMATWDAIWATLTRFATQSEVSKNYIDLLNEMLVVFRPSRVEALLQLFTRKVMPFGVASLQLLRTFLMNCTLPSLCDVGQSYNMPECNTRELLLQWLLPSPTTGIDENTMKLLPTTIHAMLVTKPEIFLTLKPQQLNLSDEKDSCIDFELILADMTFPRNRATSPESVAFETQSMQEDLGSSNAWCDSILEVFLDLLENDAKDQTTIDYRKSDYLNKVNHVFLRLKCYVYFLNNFDEKPTNATVLMKPKLERIFKQICDSHFPSFIAFISMDSHLNGIHKAVKLLNAVVDSNNLSENIQDYLRTNFGFPIELLLDKATSSCDDYGGANEYNSGHSIFLSTGFNSNSMEEFSASTFKDLKVQIRLSSLKCVISYAMRIGDTDVVLSNILDKFIHNYQYDWSMGYFELCSQFFMNSSSYYLSCDTEYAKKTIDLLQKLCKRYYKSSQCCQRLWEVFEELVPYHQKLSNLMKLVGVLSTCSKNQRQASGLAYFKFVERLAQLDPRLEWSWFPSSKSNSLICPLTELPKMFSSSNTQVLRLGVIKAMATFVQNVDWSIFQTNPSDSYESNAIEVGSTLSLKDWVPQILKVQLNESLIFPDRTDDYEKKEESVTRVAAVLMCLSKLAAANAFTEYSLILLLLELVIQKKFATDLATRAVESELDNCVKLYRMYQPLIVSQWVHTHLQVEDIPVELFGYKYKEDFYRSVAKEVISTFLMEGQMKEVEKFALSCGKAVPDLAKEHCCGLFVAAAVAHVSTNGVSPLAGAEKIQQLRKLLGGGVQIVQLIRRKLESVLIEAISYLYDPKVGNRWGLKLRLPEFTKHSLLDKDAGSLLKLIADFLNLEHSVTSELITRHPEGLYDNLEHFACSVHTSRTIYLKLWKLHQFTFLVNEVLRASSRGNKWELLRAYFTHFVTNAYLRFLKIVDESDHMKYFPKAVLTNLKSFVVKIVERDSDAVKVYLQPITQSLMKYLNSDLDTPASDIIHFLLVENGSKFSGVRDLLEPFPEDSKFKHLNVTWKEKKTEEYLWISVRGLLSSNFVCSKERLVNLRQFLHSNKVGLRPLVEALKAKRFKKDCETDVIHNLLRVLVQLIQRCHNSDVVNEAAKCLGEVGPVDLFTTVLPPHRKTFALTDIRSSISDVVNLVVNYLQDDDPSVMQTAGSVLRNLLELETGEHTHINVSQNFSQELSDLLKPFLSRSEKRVPSNVIISSTITLVHQHGSTNDDATTYTDWLTNFTLCLIDCVTSDTFLARIRPLCVLKTSFCEDVFPLIVYSVLALGKCNNLRRELSKYFRNFFAKSISCYAGAHNEDSIYRNKDALIVLLRCIQFLRGFKIPKEFKQRLSIKTLTDWDSNFWLDISYLDAAQVAQYCGAHLTSILFLEIVAAQQFDDSDADAHSLLEGDVAEQPGVHQKKDLEKLFFEGFTAIGEYDGVLGTGFARFSDFQSHIQYLQDSQCWDQILAILDAQGLGNELGICSAMINMGRYQTCWNFLAGVEATSGRLDNKLSGVHHECAWRLSRWDLDDNKVDYFVQDIEGITNAPLHKFVYESMKSSIKGDNVQFHSSLKISWGAIAEDLRHSSLESSSNLYEFLMKFQLIRVIEDLHNACQDNNLHEACEKWKLQYSFPSPDFRYQEPVLTATQVLLRQFLETKNMRTEVCHDTNEIIFDMISKARDSGRLELAEKYVHLLNGNCDATYQKEMEIAKNYWWREQHDIARQKLTFLLDQVPEDHVLYPRLLLLLGEWKLRNSVERPSVIFNNCFKKVAWLYENKISANKEEERADAYKTIAVYADGRYKNVSEYLKGKSFDDKKKLLEKMREEKELLQKKGPSDTLSKNDQLKYHRHLHTLKKNIAIDEKDIEGFQSEKVTYQSYALELYLKAMKTSNRHDLFIFRVTALWLSKVENEKPVVHPATPDIVMKSIKLPSHKFIPVIHQLSARLSDLKGATLTELQVILTNCAKEHPYHTLPVLLTQSLLNADKKFTGEAPKSTSQALSVAALNLLKGMRSSNIEMLIHKMNSFWVKLIELAYQHDKDKDGRLKDVVGKLSNIKFELADLQDLPVPTIPLQVLVNREYSSKLIRMQGIENQYYYVGGVNSPKRIVCRASNGKSYNMLLKGNDDLRQDSVMQQVFGVMNQLLESEKRTKRKRLLMRTYKVVALSQCSGIIEWCENTQTFGEYLIGKDHASGAHVMYRPKDWTPAKCRRAMIDVKDSGDAAKKLAVYQQIVKNFKPVFRHFFFENFKDPGEFFERRLAYTRSVATSSIVGYVVGLGDRHCQNILIDKNTAEVIHIDLGVAFDQGLILPTPETVPFRLTRDVVDGMGFCGTEGVFKIGCENTLEVLRKDADIILTILEVLLYDPLYFWLLSEDRKKKVQPENSDPKFLKSMKSKLVVEPVNDMEQKETTENSAAARELMKVRCKLAGIYEAVSHSPNMTVPGHVAQLINHAQEIGKLACLFHGWQPYL